MCVCVSRHTVGDLRVVLQQCVEPFFIPSNATKWIYISPINDKMEFPMSVYLILHEYLSIITFVVCGLWYVCVCESHFD